MAKGRKLCEEVGVLYYHPRNDNDIESDMKSFKVKWEHISSGEHGYVKIATFNKESILKLVNHWNRDSKWKYRV